MATKSNKYRPTGKKMLVAKYLADPEFQGSITDLCLKVGVARSTFYDWIGNEDFRAYVDELIDRYTDSELSRVWKALMRLIDRGNIQAIKLYFELKGRYKEGVGNFGGHIQESEEDPLSASLRKYAEELDDQ